MTKLRYAQKERQDYIAECLTRKGWVRRSDLVDAFGIAISQASVDMRTFKKHRPGQMKYDTSWKAYVPTPDFVPPALICTPEESKIKYYEDLIHDLTLRLMVLKACEGGPTSSDVIEFLEYLEKKLREANAR